MSEYYGHSCKCGCGELIEIRLHHKWSKIPDYINGHNRKGKKRQDVSERMKGENNPNYGKFGPESSGWKEDSDHCCYGHYTARKLFGKDCCEICGVTKEYVEKNNQYLEMHNTLIPKDYTVMEESAWMCLCKKCHKQIEKCPLPQQL